MFKPYIHKLALRYFFSKDSKTIVNRINGFAFFMIVASSSVLLVVLSAFAGLKDEKDRASVILFMNQNGDSPTPLP